MLLKLIINQLFNKLQSLSLWIKFLLEEFMLNFIIQIEKQCSYVGLNNYLK